MGVITVEGPTLIHVGLVEADGLKRDSLIRALRQFADLSIDFACGTVEQIAPNAPDVDVLVLSAVYPTQVFGEGLTLDYWQLRFPSTKLVLLANYCVRDTLHRLVGAGLHGCAIQEAVGVNELADLIRAVQHTQPALCPSAAKIYAAKPLSNVHLTYMELRILWLLRDVGTGYGRGKDCAARLGMARSTFRVHTKNICGKLEVSTIQEVLPRACELGLIEHAPLV